MDFFAHGLWSYIIFHRIKHSFNAVLFGVMPDAFSWGIYFFFNLITGSFLAGPPVMENIPQWVFMLYNITHSLFTCALMLITAYCVTRKFPMYVLAWPIALVIDIVTHTKEFLPTPFLWPVSSYAFPGISWGDGWFLWANYTLIAFCIAYIIWNRKKKSA